jgi:double-strand break repair protein MRE11
MPAGAGAGAGQPDEKDTFKILVSTDNHLGFNDECPTRADDSFNAFEEVLQLAVSQQVDLLLLGGDLFHKNKPSRKCMYRCMNLLRKYCMGDKPCPFQIISDPKQAFGHSPFQHANYEDANLNVSVPVFSINGNHDDPTGADNLCALDLLSSAGLINYFGKVSQLDHIDISPLILKKGSTKLCLFGLGAVRDERLHMMFQRDKVKMLYPRECEGDPTWFKLLVLHQNHSKHGATNYIPESFLDPALDLVIWGHEHEAKDRPQHNPTQDFYVLQPGSSVATSLCDGESAPKKSWIIKIHGEQFKAESVPLETVRPFVMRDVSLSDSGVQPRDPKAATKVVDFCVNQVEDMIKQAATQHTGHPKQPTDKPLMRLRVDYSGGYEMLNATMFGKKFVDRVANPKDVITLHRKMEQDLSKQRTMLKNLGGDVSTNIDSDRVGETRVEDLVVDYFSRADQNFQLSVLSEAGLGLAVHEFVEKEEPNAVNCIVDHQISKTVNMTSAKVKLDADDADIETVIVNCKEERMKSSSNELEESKHVISLAPQHNSTMVSDVMATASDDDDVTPAASSSRGRGRGARGAAASGRGRGAARGSRAASRTAAAPPRTQSTLTSLSRSANTSRRAASSTTNVDENATHIISDSDEEPSGTANRKRPRRSDDDQSEALFTSRLNSTASASTPRQTGRSSSRRF